MHKDKVVEGKMIERLKRDLAYEGKIIKVYKDLVRVNGRETVWDFIHHNGAAAVVAVDEKVDF